MSERKQTPFNSALETGVRTLAILVAAYPQAHDLHRLVQYDYLTVHSADADGPPSLHPPLPLRSNELLVRRHIVERGLLLMISRRLARRESGGTGFLYVAEESAGAFLNNIKAGYLASLRERAHWVVDTFDTLTAEQLDSVVRRIFQAWTTEFQAVEFAAQLELPT
jgi:ABC-three component (ABC-3C) system Middle Component 2